MSSPMTVTSFSTAMKDLYPLPGTRIKQWVVDSRRDAEWERATCPKVDVPTHDDNCGGECRNRGVLPWTFLSHDCCHACCDLHEATAQRPDIAAWIELQRARPAICADRSVLSDEVQR